MRAKNSTDVGTSRCFTSPIIKIINPFLNCFGAYRAISTLVGTFAKYDIFMRGQGVGSRRVASRRVESGRDGSSRVGSGLVGSGRVGSGRVGTGRVGPGPVVFGLIFRCFFLFFAAAFFLFFCILFLFVFLFSVCAYFSYCWFFVAGSRALLDAQVLMVG